MDIEIVEDERLDPFNWRTFRTKLVFTELEIAKMAYSDCARKEIIREACNKIKAVDEIQKGNLYKDEGTKHPTFTSICSMYRDVDFPIDILLEEIAYSVESQLKRSFVGKDPEFYIWLENRIIISKDEASALRAYIQGDSFDVKLIDSFIQKTEPRD